MAYTLIASQTLAAAQGDFSFTNIPQIYKDLIVEAVFASGSATAVEQFFRFNNDATSGNYSDTYIYGTGTSAASGRDSNQTQGRFAYTAGTDLSVSTMHIMSYTNINVYKTTFIRQGTASSGNVLVYAGLWKGTAAVTSIYISNSQNFSAGTTFKLWGIS